MAAAAPAAGARLFSLSEFVRRWGSDTLERPPSKTRAWLSPVAALIRWLDGSAFDGEDRMQLRKLPAFIYLGSVTIPLIVCMGEGYWGMGSSLSLLLALPWSVSMFVFLWTIAHDGARSLLLFLILFSGLNFFLLFKIPDWLKQWSENRARSECDE
jgi:hypothetical protein